MHRLHQLHHWRSLHHVTTNIPPLPECGVARFLSVLEGPWATLVVRELLPGKRRFTELRAALPGISPHTLTSRLRRFEAYGIVTRSVHAEVPPEPRRERRTGETLTVRLRRPCAPAKDAKAPPGPWAHLGAVRLLDHDGRIAAEPDLANIGRAPGVQLGAQGMNLVGLRIEQVESSDRNVPALWNVASANDRTVGVVGWWCTWPAETVRGKS